MERAPWVHCLLLALAQVLCAQSNAEATIFTPQDCSLECIQQGGHACEYCSVTSDDVQKALGFSSRSAFGSCVPRPCFELLGKENSHLCQHYVHAPNDVKVEFLPSSNSLTDTVVVSWRPSHFGIAFLRGFQVSLQSLREHTFSCQLLLFHRNVSLSTSHSQRVYQSNPFPDLSLHSQYVITVIALPVPEKWDNFSHSKIFTTRSCAEKNGLENCKEDWYPSYVETKQEGKVITVTFNLAPPKLGISSYFSLCYTNGLKTYIDITPNRRKNQTHSSYQMKDLQEGNNYTCEIAANEVDAVRKTFNFQVMHMEKETAWPHSDALSLAVLLPLCLVVFVMLGVMGAALIIRSKHSMRIFNPKAEHFMQDKQNLKQQEEASVSNNKQAPPRLLICYSSAEGSAHVNAVQHLGAFIQQQMATQVCLDLWDSLGLAEEGYMAWYCRQIRESDFILVVCSKSLNRYLEIQKQTRENDEEEFSCHSSDTVIRIISEEVGRAKSRGQDLSKYMAAIFEYSQETDIPTELQLVSHYILMKDLPLLFSHLHGMPLHRPGVYLNIKHLSQEGFKEVRGGVALQRAITEAGSAVRFKIGSKGCSQEPHIY